MTLTEQKDDRCYIPATVEDNRYQTEDDYYDIVDARRIDKTSTDASGISSFENKIYRTHGNLMGEKTGLGIVLKVMAGDQVKIMAESFYTMPSGGNPGSTFNMVVTDLLTALAASGPVNAAKGAVTATDVSNIAVNATDIGSFITRTPSSSTAKAYLNWILFDDQVKYVSAGADPVASNAGGGATYKLHDYFINNPVNVTKNGYLYVFVSNESNLPVYFDNLALTHTNGAILDETHYYPFGLQIASISSRSLTTQNANRLKYNGKEEQRKEFGDGNGLEWLDFWSENV